MIARQSRYHLLDAFDIPIYVNMSFVILLAIFVMDFGSFSFGVGAAIVLAASICLHELAHALTASAFGYRTQEITLSLLGGCASLISLPRKASQEFLTALAGPLVSFVLAGLCYLGIGFAPTHWLATILAYGYYMNLMLGGFNLLPGFPMDGGRIFRSVMRLFMSRTQATRVAMYVGRGFAVLLAFKALHSIFSNGGWGFITLLIAWMIWKEGYREYLMARQEENSCRWTEVDFGARVSPPPYAE